MSLQFEFCHDSYTNLVQTTDFSKQLVYFRCLTLILILVIWVKHVDKPLEVRILAELLNEIH